MSKKKSWKKFRPNSDEALESALKQERLLTANWYARMSGQIAWKPGEREKLYAEMDAKSVEVNDLIKQQNANWFANLPDQEEEVIA